MGASFSFLDSVSPHIFTTLFVSWKKERVVARKRGGARGQTAHTTKACPDDNTRKGELPVLHALRVCLACRVFVCCLACVCVLLAKINRATALGKCRLLYAGSDSSSQMPADHEHQWRYFFLPARWLPVLHVGGHCCAVPSVCVLHVVCSGFSFCMALYVRGMLQPVRYPFPRTRGHPF